MAIGNFKIPLILKGQSAPTNEPEVDVYVSGLTTPLTEGQKGRLNTFVSTIKTGLGITSLDQAFDVMYLLMGETEESSLRNLVKRSHDCTKVGSINWEKYKGFTPATSGYLNTNYSPATHAVRNQLNSASFGVRPYTWNTNAGIEMGVSDIIESVTHYFRTTLRSSGTNYTINTTTNAVFSTNPSVPQLHIFSRNGALETKYYREGVLTQTNTTAESSVLPNKNIYIGGTNSNGTLASSVQRQQSFNFVGRALTQEEVTVIKNAWDNYNTEAIPFQVVPPTDLILSDTGIMEGNAVGDLVGTFSSVDLNSLDTHTYTLVTGTGDTDNASFYIYLNALFANAVFDSSVKSSYSIRVRTTDQTGLFFEKSFVITVHDDDGTMTNGITNGSFETWDEVGGTPSGMSTFSNGGSFTYEHSDDAKIGAKSFKAVSASTNTTYTLNFINVPRASGDRIYIGFWMKTSKRLNHINVNGHSGYISVPADNDIWEWCSMRITSSSSTGGLQISVNQNNKQVGDYIMLDGIFYINLTQAFGAGAEPTFDDMDIFIRNRAYFDNTQSQVINDFRSLITGYKAVDTILQARQTRLSNNIFRIATQNLKQQYGLLYFNLARKLIIDMDVDIIGLQESTDPYLEGNKTIPRLIKNNNLAYSNHMPIARTTYSYGIVGIGQGSAFPLLDVTNIPDGYNGCNVAKVNLNGVDVMFYNTHLQVPSDNVQGKAYIDAFWNDILQYETSPYVILTADFNCPRGTIPGDLGVFQTLLDNGYVSAQGPTHGWYATYVGSSSMYLDNVLVKGFNILETGWKNPSLVSDHHPFWAEIQMIT
jgi:endonuclease/exonuclease/phosphatase family metal-dependent hydrolase